MKASELMLYDWVQSDMTGVTRVVMLDYFSSIKETYRYSIALLYRDAKGETTTLIVNESKVHGIPLTSEILTKNGFLRRESVAWREVYTYSIELEDITLENEHYLNLSPDPYGGTGFHWIPEASAVSVLCIRYVHELQHVMRLCGIKKEITI